MPQNPSVPLTYEEEQAINDALNDIWSSDIDPDDDDVVPEGLYLGVIKTVNVSPPNPTEGKAGYFYVGTQIQRRADLALPPEEATKGVRNRYAGTILSFSRAPMCQKRLKGFARIVGYTPNGGGNIDWNQFAMEAQGVNVRVKVKHRVWQGETRTECEFFPLKAEDVDVLAALPAIPDDTDFDFSNR